MIEIDKLLESYEPGDLKYKPDVTKELNMIRENREKLMKQQRDKQLEYQNSMNPQVLQQKLNEQTQIIQQLYLENNQLNDKIKYLENTIKKLIGNKIQEKKNENTDLYVDFSEPT